MPEAMAVALGNQFYAPKFAGAGLPHKLTANGKTSNTIDAHRLMTAAYLNGGAKAQDAVAEFLFHEYFANERAPGEAAVLEEAAKLAGLSLPASEYVADAEIVKETRRELEESRVRMDRNGATGVPCFFVYRDGEEPAMFDQGSSFESKFARLAK